MSQAPLVEVAGVSKKFCRDLKRSLWYGVRDIGSELVGRNGGGQSLRPGEFWAVDGVSLEVRRGECVGLLGPNGAGKTTLLRMINGLIRPDAGQITVRGRVGALIALGAGFNPLLTGRENIYVNAAVLGLTKRETDARLDEIIAFADLGEFIDAPVQSYSTGMEVRLGFAVAAALDPDVLLLDEVLAVGDAGFRNKCYNLIGRLLKQTAVVFVSHSTEQVGQLCTRALVLRRGRPAFLGDVERAIEVYLEESAQAPERPEMFGSVTHPVVAASAEIAHGRIGFGGHATLRLRAEAAEDVGPVNLRVYFYLPDGRVAAEWNARRSGRSLELRRGGNEIEVELGPVNLISGRYRLGITLNEFAGIRMLYWSFKEHEIVVEGSSLGGYPYQMV